MTAVPGERPIVGFLGAGRMGLPMIVRMTAAGFDVVGLARRPETADRLRELGARVVATAAEAAAEADVLIVCTFDEAQTRDALLGSGAALAALAPGAVVVVHTTCSPSLSIDLQAAAPAGVRVLDVPVSGRAPDTLAGRLTLLVGGDIDALETVRPVVASYSNPIIHLGPLGAGQRTKLLNNLIFAVNARLALEVAELAGQLGLDPTTTLRAIQSSSGTSLGLATVATADTPTEVITRLRQFLDKDVSVVQTLADELGVDLGQLGEIAAWWRTDNLGARPATAT